MNRLEEIKARNNARTPGKWFWYTNRRHRSVGLKAPQDGGTMVMDFVRWGMHSAQPRFNDTGPHFGGILRTMEEYDTEEIPNPNAEFMSGASEDIPWLIARIEQLEAAVDTAKSTFMTISNLVGDYDVTAYCDNAISELGKLEGPP